MDWIRDRKPRRDELRMISSSGDRPHFGEHFLVWDGEAVDIDYFEVQSCQDSGGPNEGYWRQPGVLAWQPLPPAPTKTISEEEGHASYQGFRSLVGNTRRAGDGG